MNTSSSLLEIIDLHKSFGSTHVLNGVNLRVERGEVIAIIGVSGSGTVSIPHDRAPAPAGGGAGLGLPPPAGRAGGRGAGRPGRAGRPAGQAGPSPSPKTLIFLRKITISIRRHRTGTAPAPHRHRTGNRPGKDNLAPAEDVHNKNPSLVALGKTCENIWGKYANHMWEICDTYANNM